MHEQHARVRKREHGPSDTKRPARMKANVLAFITAASIGESAAPLILNRATAVTCPLCSVVESTASNRIHR
jgi:hypothetical protein